MSKKASCQKGFTRVKGKVKMVIMDTILCGKGLLLARGLTRGGIQSVFPISVDFPGFTQEASAASVFGSFSFMIRHAC